MIVEAFDPVNDVESRLGAGCVSELIDAFDLRRLEEASCWPCDSSIEHPEVGNQLPVAIARVRAAAVRMHDQPRLAASILNSSEYRRLGTVSLFPTSPSVHQNVCDILMYVKPWQGHMPLVCLRNATLIGRYKYGTSRRRPQGGKSRSSTLRRGDRPKARPYSHPRCVHIAGAAIRRIHATEWCSRVSQS
jgi:hypothetical protein